MGNITETVTQGARHSHLLRLTRAIASGRVSTLITVNTGPNISILTGRRRSGCLVVRMEQDDGRREKTDSLVTLVSLLGLQYRWSHPVTIREAVDLVSTTIEQDLATLFLAGRDKTLDLLPRCWRDYRSSVSRWYPQGLVGKFVLG
jgi:hypothetical protein